MRKIFFLIIGLIAINFSTANAQNFKSAIQPSTKSDTSGQNLLIPNAFTPNNDGVNDIFKIVNFSEQKLVEFKVFNRWGTILFHTTDPKKGWDGTFNGKPQPLGVYGYVIRIAANGVVETYKGTVTLLR